MGAMINRMIRKVDQYRGAGALPEVFIAGRSTIQEMDSELVALLDLLVADTRTSKNQGRRYREVCGVPVVFSHTARKDCLELVVRRSGGPAMVETLR